MSQISVLQYCYMLISLRVDLSPINFDISLAYLRILMILDSVYGQLRSTWRLRGILRNFICVTSISCNLKVSLHMVPLFKRLLVITATFLTHISGNPLIYRKGINMSL